MAVDYITLLKCSPSRVAAKTWTESGCQDYDCGFRFDAVLQEVSSLVDLASLLGRLRACPSVFAVRAVPKLGVNHKALVRRSRGDDAPLEDSPHRWLMLDVDSLELPNFAIDPADAAARVRHLLPECFRTASCYWHASGSAGFKPGVRLHLWFWLDREFTGLELKRWVRNWPGVKIDVSVFTAVQPHYTADPILRVPDPMHGNRAGILAGEPEVRVPERLLISDSMREAASTALSKALWHIKRAEEGARNNALFVQARKVARWAEVLDESVKDRLAEVAIDAGLSETETAATIDSAWRGAKPHDALKHGNILAGMMLDEHGRIRVNPPNLSLLFEEHPELVGLIATNVRTGDLVLTRRPPWYSRAESFPSAVADADALHFARWLFDTFKIVCPNTIAMQTLQQCADLETVDPWLDYLESLEWDEQPRLERWLTDCVGAENTLYTRAVAKRWMISAVARTFAPGCKVDSMLVLIGEQGQGKSTLFLELAGERFFSELQVKIDSEEAYMLTRGPVIVELADLASLSKREVESIKAHITIRVDRRRGKYARLPTSIPRRYVYAGTTNDFEPFQDATGNRRFWPVIIQSIDIPKLHSIRDQLWAEAVALYRKGEQWHLTKEETALAMQEQEDARAVGTVEERLRELLSKMHVPTAWPPDYLDSAGYLVKIMATDAMRMLELDLQGRSDRQLAQAFRALGWKRKSSNGKRFYRRPE